MKTEGIAFKKWTLPILGVVGILASILYISTSSPKVVPSEPVVEPAIVPFKEYIGGSGLTEASNEDIAVATQVAGVIQAVYVKAGDKVKKDDPLFRIEDRTAHAQVVQAEAKLLNIQASLQDVKEQMGIISRIQDKRAISRDEYNKKKNALAIAKTQVQVSEAELKLAKINVDLCLVKAPLEGVIMTVNAKVGEYASTGALPTPLIRMGNLDNLHIRVDIDENDAWRFKKGAKALAFLRGNPNIQVPLSFIRVEPYVRPKRSLTGASIERVDTRVLQVIYSFDTDKSSIYAGQQMDVYIAVENTHDKNVPDLVSDKMEPNI